VGEGLQRLRTVLRGEMRPRSLIEGGSGGLDGPVDVHGRRGGSRTDSLLGRRRDDLDDVVGFRLDHVAADEETVADEGRGLADRVRRHGASSSGWAGDGARAAARVSVIATSVRDLRAIRIDGPALNFSGRNPEDFAYGRARS